jgi:hypothetical protein
MLLKLPFLSYILVNLVVLYLLWFVHHNYNLHHGLSHGHISKKDFAAFLEHGVICEFDYYMMSMSMSCFPT